METLAAAQIASPIASFAAPLISFAEPRILFLSMAMVPERFQLKARRVWMFAAFERDTEAAMGKSIIDLSSVTRVGLDLGMNILQVHPVDARGVLAFARQVAARRARGFLRLNSGSLPPLAAPGRTPT